MKLRIISGILKGRYLTVPETNNFRPTLERTRQSIAEIIKMQIPGYSVADVCAGSGAMGFEMLSRGALKVDFIEKDHRIGEQIRKNAHHFGVEDRCKVIVTDALSFINNQSNKYDIIFYDPPYDNKELKTASLSLIENLSDDGIFIYEQRKPRSRKDAQKPEPLIPTYDSRVFGETVVEFFKKQSCSANQ